MLRLIRKLRHWKQRFDPNASFVFRRRTVFGSKRYNSGDLIPEELATNKGKLRLFWECRRIELAYFDAPNVATGQVEKSDSDDVKVEQRGPWYFVKKGTKEEKVRGKDNLDKLLAEWRSEF